MNFTANDFWQESWTCAGFREFPKEYSGHDWHFNVDAGPVLGGFGCAACAFGVGAARVNGHFEQAYPLTTEMLVTSWPLPNGTRLFPRLLSNAADAPLLGEAGILFNLTRMPGEGVSIKTGGSIPKFVFVFLALQFGIGLILLIHTIRSPRRWQQQGIVEIVPQPNVQFGIWGSLLVGCVICLFWDKPLLAMLLLMCSQLFPQHKQRRVIP